MTNNEKPELTADSATEHSAQSQRPAERMNNGNSIVKLLIDQKGIESREEHAPQDGVTNKNKTPESTLDTHVGHDDTDKGMVRNTAGKVARNTWFIPGLSNMLQGIEKSDGSPGGIMEGAKNGFEKTRRDGLDTALGGGVRGDFASVVKGYAEAVAKSEATPVVVKEVLLKILEWMGGWWQPSSPEAEKNSNTARSGA